MGNRRSYHFLKSKSAYDDRKLNKDLIKLLELFDNYKFVRIYLRISNIYIWFICWLLNNFIV
jgi:hypothetical protein